MDPVFNRLLNNKGTRINISSLIITTNHIYIGVVYIITGLIGGSIGFGLSIILRLELALPRFIVGSSLQYNSNISFHEKLMECNYFNLNIGYFDRSDYSY